MGLAASWTVTRSEFAAEDGRLDLHVDFPRGSRFACAECGREGCAVHDTKDETWRHLDFFQHRTLLHARVPRVSCPDCGVRKVATPWARAALAERGDAGAQALVGNMYARGLGVAYDRTEAVRWWRKAAGQGDASAQEELATAYFWGNGVQQDQRL